jgi:hypothetical protein
MSALSPSEFPSEAALSLSIRGVLELPCALNLVMASIKCYTEVKLSLVISWRTVGSYVYP